MDDDFKPVGPKTKQFRIFDPYGEQRLFTSVKVSERNWQVLENVENIAQRLANETFSVYVTETVMMARTVKLAPEPRR